MKKAFTLLELVFVIVIIGIISVVMIPRTGSNKVREAATQLVSHIKYTQHLAMVDDRYDTNKKRGKLWFAERWQIYFANDGSGNRNLVYTIYSDRDRATNADGDEIALNPLNEKLMTGDSKYGVDSITDKMNLTASYGIDSIAGDIMTGGCVNRQRLFFDFLGRPHFNNDNAHSRLMITDCNISICDNGDCATITIEAETGYAHILEP